MLHKPLRESPQGLTGNQGGGIDVIASIIAPLAAAISQVTGVSSCVMPRRP